ncbi:MAG: GNAT family N-acetyltransferase [Burkholderiales bacterium]|nr:GNAT family N-acetyltransferase [Burkholderiales bacterium]
MALRRALFPHHDAASLRAEMDRFVAQPDRHAQFLVIDEDGSPAGLAEVSLHADPAPGTPGARGAPVAFLEAIYVVPHARRHGLARALVTHACAWARAQGCCEFASDALLGNADGLALHRALGFEDATRIVRLRQRTAG